MFPIHKDYLKLKNNPLKGCFHGLFISSIFVLFLIVKNIILGWKPINFHLGVLWIGVFMVGILEEIPFRGVLLQSLSPHMKFWAANLLTTVIFIMLHMPTWTFSNINILQAIKSTLIFSMALGYLFKEYDSLWVPIICHSVFNLCIWIGLA